jgi:hypothetical protein
MTKETAFRGPSGPNLMAWILQVTSGYLCKVIDRSKTRHQPCQQPQVKLASTSIKKNTLVLKINTFSTDPVILNENNLEEVGTFTYLGIVINQQGGTDSDVKSKIEKA